MAAQCCFYRPVSFDLILPSLVAIGVGCFKRGGMQKQKCGLADLVTLDYTRTRDIGLSRDIST